MNEWLIGALVLLVMLVPADRGGVARLDRPAGWWHVANRPDRSATLILLLLSQGFARQPFVDLGADHAAVMSFIGSVASRGLHRTTP